MRTVVRKMGNSSGVIIPKPFLAEIGTEAGDNVEMTVEAGSIVLRPVTDRPRAGWAEASRELAQTGDDALVWPEFANEADTDLEW